jgi:hypothetical protein
MKKMRELVAQIATIGGGFLLFLFFLTYGTGTMRDMPDNAIVLLDDQARTYTTPPCISPMGGLRPARAADAYAINYKPDSQCKEKDGFFQRGRSLWGKLLEKVGLLSPLPSR